jgi:biofilm PGA synthesis N-glycosyltransferase PgaC
MHWLLLIFILPYIFFLIRIAISLNGIKPFNAQIYPARFISIVVACRNEEKNLPILLDALAGQGYPASSFEIIIIDDNSVDRTYSVASEYTSIKNLKVLMSVGKGKKLAIRKGIETATGDLIVTTDADCIMGSRWLSSIASFVEEKNPDLLICPVILSGGRGFFQQFQELEFLSLQGITAGTAVSGDPVMCNGANMAFRREIYLANSANLHDEIASGDDVFLLHAVKNNKANKIMWLESPDAFVITGTSSTLKKFIRQRTRWISKAGAYKDMFTRVIGTVTFLAVIFQALMLPASLLNPTLLPLFIVGLILKSVPDLLILINTTKRYKKRNLMKWFLPSQLVYPYYILIVVLIQAFRSSARKAA